MSLEDELMADLAEEEEEEELVDEQEAPAGGSTGASGKMEVDIDTKINRAIDLVNNKDQELTTERLLENIDFSGADLTGISTLMAKLNPILDRIRTDNVPPRATDLKGNLDNHPSYRLLVEANDYALEIDNELQIVYKYIKDLYSKRFDGLDQLTPGIVAYAKTVKVVGNDVGNVNLDKLKPFLEGPERMNISLAAYSNNGRSLTDYELNQVLRACDLILELDNAKVEITDYVSSRAPLFAPNVTQIIEPHVAAQILGFVGGLAGLSRIPNSNIPSLGNKRTVGLGFGQTAKRKQGFIAQCSLVRQMPDKQNQAMKIVAGKLVLAARVDLQHSSPDGSMGQKWRKEIEERLNKLLEAPEVVKTKALPVPVENQGKKRGGRRYRKQKELWGQTEVHKAQNRVGFNSQVGDYGDDEDQVVGNLQTAGGGPIKVSAGNKAKFNKKEQARIDQMRQRNANGFDLPDSLGGASEGSLLVNPDASAPKTQSSKWFGGTKRKLDLNGSDASAKRQK